MSVFPPRGGTPAVSTVKARPPKWESAKAYIVPGACNDFVVPQNVTQLLAVVVGAGGSGGCNASSGFGTGGGGGGFGL